MIDGPPTTLAWVEPDAPRELVPMNDIREHVPGMSCWCDPDVNEAMAIIHNALDRREDYIFQRRRLN